MQAYYLSCKRPFQKYAISPVALTFLSIISNAQSDCHITASIQGNNSGQLDLVSAIFPPENTDYVYNMKMTHTV